MESSTGESGLRMAEARPPPSGPAPSGPSPSPALALAPQRLAFRHLPKAVALAPGTRNSESCTFVPFTQAVPVQVDMAMALHRVRIAEKYGKNYLCLLQAVFLAGEYDFPVHSHPVAWDGEFFLPSSRLPPKPACGGGVGGAGALCPPQALSVFLLSLLPRIFFPTSLSNHHPLRPCS